MVTLTDGVPMARRGRGGRDRAAAAGHARDRTDHGQHSGGHAARHVGLPPGARPVGLARSDTQATRERRQGTIGNDLDDGRGTCYDNAMVETFCKTIKSELI